MSGAEATALIISIAFTAWAAVAASRAARAAEEAVVATQQTVSAMAAAERGRLYFASFEKTVTEFEGRKRIAFSFANGGRTTAILDDICLLASYKKIFPTEFPPESRMTIPYVIAAGATQMVLTFDTDDGVYVFGMLDYEDVFRERHRYHIGLRVAGARVEPIEGEGQPEDY